MVTLKDIAEKAGVNVSSVSKALNDSKEISLKKRKEIKKIAQDLNYIPNLSARALAGKGTNSIGVILPEIRSNYYAEIMNQIESELSITEFSIIMSTTNFDLDNEIHYLNVLCSRGVDAIILIGAMHERIENYVSEIKSKYSIPILFLESFVELKHHDYIMIDNSHGINLAIEHLKQLGIEEIGFISEDISASTRLDMFKEGLRNNNLKYNKRFVKIGDERFERGGYLRMMALLKEPKPPGAVFASYDDMAIGAMKAIEEAGYTVPDDIAVVGFDNIRVANYLTTPLTTIVPPIKEMVGLGIKILMEKITSTNENLSHKLVLKPHIVVRGSTFKDNKFTI